MPLTPDEMSDIVIFYTASVTAFGKNKPIIHLTERKDRFQVDPTNILSCQS